MIGGDGETEGMMDLDGRGSVSVAVCLAVRRRSEFSHGPLVAEQSGSLVDT